MWILSTNKFKKAFAVLVICILSILMFGIIAKTIKDNCKLTLFVKDKEILKKVENILKNCITEEEKQSALWLIKNMENQYSYDNSISQSFLQYIKTASDSDIKRLWLNFNAQNTEEPKLIKDIEKIDANLFVESIKESIKIWKDTPWHNEVSFNQFCKYILPYKIDKEPFVDWKIYYRDKYSFLVKGILNMQEAFQKIYEFEKNNFPVKNTFFPYEQDPLLLDNLHGGNCRQRAFHMAYIMRALGIPVAVDYTPIWGNYGENGHYWVALINNYEKATILSKHIDGAYEKSVINYKNYSFTSSIDSLKKISKIYRLTFWKSNSSKLDEKLQYEYLNNNYTCDVTRQYDGITKDNTIEAPSRTFSNLFVCTYSQKEGWVPVGKAKRINDKKIDIGPLLDDNIIIVADYKDDCLIPISSPFLIRHNKRPLKIEPDFSKTIDIKLHRKYLLRTTWINRWSEIIGTKIETSDDKMFKNEVSSIFYINKLPSTEAVTIPLKGEIKDYIRIFPKDNVFPVFAELQLLDKNSNILNQSKYEIYAIGESLTGDTIVTKKLQDDNLSTTFYKRFPFWIGFKVDNIKEELNMMRIIMWNDENQIQAGHDYELFYFYNTKWYSMGRKKATSSYLEFKNVPNNALFLLKDYSHGKEERIFIYKNNKQIWY